MLSLLLCGALLIFALIDLLIFVRGGVDNDRDNR